VDSDQTFWHARYRQQSGWTGPTRKYIFKQAGISRSDHLLETGFGSGAVLEKLDFEGYRHLTGIDLDFKTLETTKIPHPFACADGLQLPFQDASFDHSLCHFYLMWLSDPLTALREMARVTAPDGYVLALAEPDYGGRIYHPKALERLGEMQTKALHSQGADVHIGRRLLTLFMDCGLDDVNAGIISAQWKPGTKIDSFSDDWQMLTRDLSGAMPENELEALLSHAKTSVSKENSIWFVPIFYAYGHVPSGDVD